MSKRRGIVVATSLAVRVHRATNVLAWARWTVDAAQGTSRHEASLQAWERARDRLDALTGRPRNKDPISKLPRA